MCACARVRRTSAWQLVASTCHANAVPVPRCSLDPPAATFAFLAVNRSLGRLATSTDTEHWPLTRCPHHLSDDVNVTSVPMSVFCKYLWQSVWQSAMLSELCWFRSHFIRLHRFSDLHQSERFVLEDDTVYYFHFQALTLSTCAVTMWLHPAVWVSMS